MEEEEKLRKIERERNESERRLKKKRQKRGKLLKG